MSLTATTEPALRGLSSSPLLHPSTLSPRPFAEFAEVAMEGPVSLPEDHKTATLPGAPFFPQERVESLPPGSQAASNPTLASNACASTLCTAVRASAAEPILHEAQRRWAATPLTERLQPIRRARHWIAEHPELFAKAISPQLTRSNADTLATEILPLLDAMRFLERKAQRLLAPRELGGKDRPLWLTGVQAEIHRDPFGHILIIGPANFPLFLPGVQTVQALVAGNAVTWKPGSGGERVAALLAHTLRESGLPRGLLHVTDDSVEAAQISITPPKQLPQLTANAAPAWPPGKVIFTGSRNTGRQILRTLAETATPAVMELSGADAVIVLPSADLTAAAKAIAFGLRLNGAQVCMSPRRLIATRETLQALQPLLINELAKLPAVSIPPRTAQTLQTLLTDALSQGAELLPLPTPSKSSDPSLSKSTIYPILLDHATPQMAITQTDLFAPVLSLIEAPTALHIADLVNSNPYGLAATIFGAPVEAEALAGQLRVGTVLINDLIAPTADPRVPFGGRGHSGFGLTRGAEGLLEMTVAKTILLRRRPLTRHYAPLGTRDLPLFTAMLGLLHAGSLRQRWRFLKQLVTTVRNRPVLNTEHQN